MMIITTKEASEKISIFWKSIRSRGDIGISSLEAILEAEGGPVLELIDHTKRRWGRRFTPTTEGRYAVRLPCGVP